MASLIVSRRAFIESVAGGMALSAISRRTLSARQSIQQVPRGPNDQIVLGMVGVGRQGMSRLREFLKHADTRIAAISDVDRDHADRAVAEVEKVRGQKPKAFSDFRRVLEDREIDAVVVVTPDHWHAIPTVRAFEVGKDVFVEKPLSYSVAEGRMMADASVKYKRVSQMGNHIHNDSRQLPARRRARAVRPARTHHACAHLEDVADAAGGGDNRAADRASDARL